MTTPILSSYKTISILEDLQVDLEITTNPYRLNPDHLFEMAARINKKRHFLFVSKVLGKHLAIDPKIGLLIGHLLAMRYLEVVHGYVDPRAVDVAEAIQSGSKAADLLRSIEEQPLKMPRPLTAIGFAETATALGHACFSTFGSDVHYIHTTREDLAHHSSRIQFEEEHSHATSHRVYAQDPDFFANDHDVLLIDDEITTGQTVINIIRTIKQQYPMKTRFAVLSILDWRTQPHVQAFKDLERELDLKIDTVSLIKGTCQIKGDPKLMEESEVNHSTSAPPPFFLSFDSFVEADTMCIWDHVDSPPYLKATGRFGWSSEEEHAFRPVLEQMAKALKTVRKGKRTLVIGTGELMYLPMKLASLMGAGVSVQSTTRSPIYQTGQKGYVIQTKYQFDSPETEGIRNYLYNIGQNQYDDLFILLERGLPRERVASLLEALEGTGVLAIHVVTFTKAMENEIGGELDDAKVGHSTGSNREL